LPGFQLSLSNIDVALLQPAHFFSRTEVYFSSLKKSHWRQIEFIGGRKVACDLLQKMGCNVESIGVSNGLPIWPFGFIGSISHCENVVAVAVASLKNCRGVGLDVERIADPCLSNELSEICVGMDEVNLFSEIRLPKSVKYTLAFSAKEAIFKCIFPIDKTFIDFDDLHILNVDLDVRVVRVKLKKEVSEKFKSGHVFYVRYEISSSMVFTLVELNDF
jgi:enterobactin synthetase component D